MKFKLREFSCSNMEEWKSEIIMLWVTRESNSNCLKKLVESLPRKLAEVIKKEGVTTIH
jgi:hypothetical protein